MIVAFSGTRAGMTPQQKAAVRLILAEFPSRPRRLALHGCCVGADADFHALARESGWFIVGCPGKPEGDPNRAMLDCDELCPLHLPLRRNALMVAQCDFFIATPKEFENPGKGGTWFSIGEARKRGVGRRIIYPDGSIDTERTWGQDAPQQAELELVAPGAPR